MKFLALQLAFQFEAYTIHCEQIVSDNRTVEARGGSAGTPIQGVPSPTELPASDVYRFFEPDILNRIFGFSQRCAMCEREAAFVFDVARGEESQEAAEENTIMLGLEALELAQDIRKKYGLGERLLVFKEWDTAKSLREEMARIEDRKTKLAKANEKLFD